MKNCADKKKTFNKFLFYFVIVIVVVEKCVNSKWHNSWCPKWAIENDINKDSIDIMLCEDNNHYNNNNNKKIEKRQEKNRKNNRIKNKEQRNSRTI